MWFQSWVENLNKQNTRKRKSFEFSRFWENSREAFDMQAELLSVIFNGFSNFAKAIPQKRDNIHAPLWPVFVKSKLNANSTKFSIKFACFKNNSNDSFDVVFNLFPQSTITCIKHVIKLNLLEKFLHKPKRTKKNLNKFSWKTFRE